MNKFFVAAVVAVAVVVAGIGTYFMMKPGAGEGGAPSGGNSKVEITFTPSTLHVGDSRELEISVTNNHST